MIVIESTMYLDNQGFPGLAGPAANRAFTVHDEFCDWHARQRFGHYAQVWLYAARGGIWHMKGRMGVYLCPLKPRVSWREVLGQHRETGQSGGKK